MLDRCWIDVRWTFDRFLMGFRWVGYVDIPRETESKATTKKIPSRFPSRQLEARASWRLENGSVKFVKGKVTHALEFVLGVENPPGPLASACRGFGVENIWRRIWRFFFFARFAGV